ncbi:hypothetical protein LCGC14_0495410 [marine sediment metagenome]|uniref:Uncharacterized protein n=1 Tax=marine sediment metagenome TaxID=412755 RepID=A0A0F9SAN6_9ZZZZ
MSKNTNDGSSIIFFFVALAILSFLAIQTNNESLLMLVMASGIGALAYAYNEAVGNPENRSDAILIGIGLFLGVSVVLQAFDQMLIGIAFIGFFAIFAIYKMVNK